jgi:hypothetical protein
MDNKLSELSKPAGHFIEWQDEETGEREWCECSKENGAPLYSQEYVSDLLAELEAKDKRIAELEEQKAMWVSVAKELGSKCDALEAMATDYAGKFQKAQDSAKHLIIMNDRAQAEIAHLKASLATPVQLQNCDFESVAIMAHWCTDEQLEAWVKGVEHAKKQIRASGFKVEGDE